MNKNFQPVWNPKLYEFVVASLLLSLKAKWFLCAYHYLRYQTQIMKQPVFFHLHGCLSHHLCLVRRTFVLPAGMYSDTNMAVCVLFFVNKCFSLTYTSQERKYFVLFQFLHLFCIHIYIPKFLCCSMYCLFCVVLSIVYV